MFGTGGNHDLHLHEAMERSWEADIKLNFANALLLQNHVSSFEIYNPPRSNT